MTYCILRSSMIAQPPLTIPEIALRLGVHPAYYQNGIKVFELSRLPAGHEFCPEGSARAGPAAGSGETSGPAKPETNTSPHGSGKSMSEVIAAWEKMNETLIRVDPVNPPPIKEDGKHAWRFDGGPQAEEEVFLPGERLPQWDVNLHKIALKQIALVPPGGALRIPRDDEPADQNIDSGYSTTALIVAAAGFSVGMGSEESAAHHDPGLESTAHHDPGHESAAYHDPGQYGPEHSPSSGMDQQHISEQEAQQREHDAVQNVEEYIQSQGQADEGILHPSW
jgi:hypothetical protein